MIMQQHLSALNPVGVALSSLMWGNADPNRSQADVHQYDQRLVRAALAGEHKALEEVLSRLRFVPAMVYVRHRRMGSPLGAHELEDIAQEVLTSVWTKLAEFQGGSKLESWVYGFCIREIMRAIDRGRRGGRRQVVDDLDSLPHEASGDPETYDYLHQALLEVGNPAAEIIRLKHFGKDTFDRIGARLGISANTAKSQYYRGLKRLRVLLEPTWRKEQN